MAIKKVDRSILETIETMISDNAPKLKIASATGLAYAHVTRILSSIPKPFSADAYEEFTNSYNSEMSEYARSFRKVGTKQHQPKSAEPVTADNAIRTVVDNGYQAPKGPFKYSFEETNALRQCDVKKYDVQELKRMYEADEAPFPVRGLIKHDSDILDRWCFNANHVLTIEDAKRAIEADYYALEIFHSYGLATPEMVEYMNSIA